MNANRRNPVVANRNAGTSRELTDFMILPLNDREVARIRTVLGRSSEHTARFTQMLEAQAGNPRISEENRQIYVLYVSDVERIEDALCDAVVDASTVRKKQLTAIRRWIRRHVNDAIGGK